MSLKLEMHHRCSTHSQMKKMISEEHCCENNGYSLAHVQQVCIVSAFQRRYHCPIAIPDSINGDVGCHTEIPHI